MHSTVYPPGFRFIASHVAVCSSTLSIFLVTLVHSSVLERCCLQYERGFKVTRKLAAEHFAKHDAVLRSKVLMAKDLDALYGLLGQEFW